MRFISLSVESHATQHDRKTQLLLKVNGIKCGRMTLEFLRARIIVWDMIQDDTDSEDINTNPHDRQASTIESAKTMVASAFIGVPLASCSSSSKVPILGQICRQHVVDFYKISLCKYVINTSNASANTTTAVVLDNAVHSPKIMVF